MNKRILKVTAAIAAIAALTFTATALADKKEKLGDQPAQAKRLMTEDKALHKEVSAALKAKDAAKIQAIFRRKGLTLSDVVITAHGPNGHCFQIGPNPNNVVCDF